MESRTQVLQTTPQTPCSLDLVLLCEEVKVLGKFSMYQHTQMAPILKQQAMLPWIEWFISQEIRSSNECIVERHGLHYNLPYLDLREDVMFCSILFTQSNPVISISQAC
jgi:hypothetical protein